jgi:hypothetical protein
MVSCKDKIVIFALFNTCYPQNLARNLASFFGKTYSLDKIFHLFKTVRGIVSKYYFMAW